MMQTSGMMQSRLFVPWLALVAVCATWMWCVPTHEVVPFHLVWISFALAYGFEAWPLRPTILACLGATMVTGGILVVRAASGVVAWPETSEILLMLLLAGLVVWHVQRREAALASLTLLADRETTAAAQRVRLARLTSHELRTPLTIAQSYVELMLERTENPELQEELEAVHDELSRVTRVSNRLLRMIQLAEPFERAPVDLCSLLRETAHRWAAVADRDWVVDCDGVSATVSVERIRACLDTLIENAVRYTIPGDRVRLFGFAHERDLWFGVADGGPGFEADLAAAVNAQQPPIALLARAGSHQGLLSQTGLGIALVQEFVDARGGRVLVGRSHEGGAVVLLMVPLHAERYDSAAETSVRQNPRAASEAELWAAISRDPMPVTRPDQ